jgi:hypothetical protein
MKAEDDRANQYDASLGIRQQNADTSKSKGSKVFYFVSPTTKNVMSFTGTADDAQAQLEKVQASKPDENIVMTDKEPDGLKDLNKIPIDDQHTLHASDEDALKYYTAKMQAKAKVDAAGAKPAGGSQPAYDITKVEHLPNKAFVPAAGISATNQPTMSVTNTVSRRPVAANAAQPPLAPGLPNLKSNLITIPDDVSADVAGAIQRGNDAIQKGADPAKVKARLKELYGYDL